MKQDDGISSLPTALIFGIPVFSGHYQSLLKNLHNHLLLGVKGGLWWLTTPNAEQIVQASRDDTFRSCLMNSTITVPDGASLVLSSGLLALRGTETSSVRERISGVDLMTDLVAMAVQLNKRVLLVGGDGDVALKATSVLRIAYPVVRIKSDPGARNIKAETQAEKQRVIDKIRRFKPDMLFVGYGAPYQEAWIADNRLELSKIGVRIVMGVGGAFAMVAGILPRSPKWMREVGLEWLWRLWQEPWRWKRQTRLLTYWMMVGRELFRIKNN